MVLLFAPIREKEKHIIAQVLLEDHDPIMLKDLDTQTLENMSYKIITKQI